MTRDPVRRCKVVIEKMLSAASFGHLGKIADLPPTLRKEVTLWILDHVIRAERTAIRVMARKEATSSAHFEQSLRFPYLDHPVEARDIETASLATAAPSTWSIPVARIESFFRPMAGAAQHLHTDRVR
ncbi:MAG: hypothetical protein ACREJ0_15250 [Geminicoccaceae bacterium]